MSESTNFETTKELYKYHANSIRKLEIENFVLQNSIHDINAEKSNCVKDARQLEKQKSDIQHKLSAITEENKIDDHSRVGSPANIDNDATLNHQLEHVDQNLQRVNDQKNALEASRSEKEKKIFANNLNIQDHIDNLSEIFEMLISKYEEIDESSFTALDNALTRPNVSTKSDQHVEDSDNNSSHSIFLPSQSVSAAGFLKFRYRDVRADDRRLHTRQIEMVEICSDELEHRIQELLDHLTSRRIAEEMDTSTYLLRLNKFFERAAKRARKLGETQVDLVFRHYKESDPNIPVDNLHTEINEFVDFTKNLSSLEAEVPKWRRRNDNNRDQLKGKFKELFNATRRIGERLSMFELDVCNTQTISDIRRISGFVSGKIQSSRVFQFWPFAWTVFSTLGVKYALSLSRSSIVVDFYIAILISFFISAYFISCWFGRLYRRAIMSQVEDRVRRRTLELLSEPAKGGFMRHALLWIAKAVWGRSVTESQRNFEFLPIPTSSLINESLSNHRVRFSFWKIRLGPRVGLIVRNGILILLPTVALGSLFSIANIQPGPYFHSQFASADPTGPNLAATSPSKKRSRVERNAYEQLPLLGPVLAKQNPLNEAWSTFAQLNEVEPEEVFIGSYPDGSDCKLATGQLIYSSDDSYFVLAEGTRRTTAGLIFFPEAYARRLRKDETRRVKHTSQWAALDECAPFEALNTTPPSTLVSVFSHEHNPEPPVAISARDMLLLENSVLELKIDLLKFIADQDQASIEQPPSCRDTGQHSGENQTCIDSVNVSESLTKLEESLNLFKVEIGESRLAMQFAFEALSDSDYELSSNLKKYFQTNIQLVNLIDDLQERMSTPEADLNTLINAVAALDTTIAAIEELNVSFGDITNELKIILPSNWPPSMTIFVNGVKEYETSNSLLLPFYPDPVLGTKRDVDEAFDHGRRNFRDLILKDFTFMDEKNRGSGNSDNDDARIERVVHVEGTDNGVISNSRSTYIGYFVESIKDNLEKRSVYEDREGQELLAIQLDIIGFASESWKLDTTDNEKSNLNHALAEGRRAGLIELLKTSLDTVLSQVNIVSQNDQAPICLRDWKMPDEVQFEEEKNGTYVRFNGPADLDKFRRDFFVDADLSDHPLNEFLKRSVLIRISYGERICDS